MKSADIDRLEQMMQSMNQKGDDPEMAQLNGMLEKIMDIQNPARVQEQLRQTSEKKRGQVFAVETGKKADPVSSLDKQANTFDRVAGTQSPLSGNGFYSFDQSPAGTDSQNAIQAVVHETQTLVNGSTVKLRLVGDIFINGVLIPHDQFIYGLAALNGERLAIKISSIRYRNSLFPVELSVYDMDGLDGIYIPGAISREVAKTSTEQGMQNIGLTTLDPSIGMQAAGVGIEAAKSFLSKKVKLIRVSVKAGYQVLLHDEKQKQQN